MIYIKNLILLLLTLIMAAYAYGDNRGRPRSLKNIKNGHNYQVRVRTGNLALDKKVYIASTDIFSEFLPISDEASYTGFIEVVFSSTLGQGVLGSKPAYPTDVVYGENWFTSTTNAEFSSPMDFESNEGGILRWQKSHMTVSIKDIKENTLWSSEYTYKGTQDISGLLSKANEGANLCLDRIISKFKFDFNIDQQPEKKRKLETPTIGLVVKSRWKNAGNNSLGHSISVDSDSISYLAPDIFSVWVQSDFHEYNFMDLIEINCKNKSFKYLEGRLDKNPSLAPHVAEWTVISPESTPERVHRLLCPEQ